MSLFRFHCLCLVGSHLIIIYWSKLVMCDIHSFQIIALSLAISSQQKCCYPDLFVSSFFCGFFSFWIRYYFALNITIKFLQCACPKDLKNILSHTHKHALSLAITATVLLAGSFYFHCFQFFLWLFLVLIRYRLV